MSWTPRLRSKLFEKNGYHISSTVFGPRSAKFEIKKTILVRKTQRDGCFFNGTALVLYGDRRLGYSFSHMLFFLIFIDIQ